MFGHTPVVVSIGSPATLENTLIAAHSYDADWRPLSTYEFQEIRFLHILGAYQETGGEEAPPPRPERPPLWNWLRPPFWFGRQRE